MIQWELFELKKNTAVILIFALLLGLCACSSDDETYEETVLTVLKRGKVTENIVESFDKDYYNIEELSSEFSTSIDEYNNSIGSEEIKLDRIELKDSKVYVDLIFTGPSDYEKFVGQTLFVGTVSDAYDNGYTLDVTLKGVEKGDLIGKIQLMGMMDNNIIILSEHVRIKTFSDIAYVSANVDVIDDRNARVLSESDGLAYIILE